tara:strand:- start:56618 stop:57238 length:621 start_codon:yes stop_codon:yes gene_type:complete
MSNETLNKTEIRRWFADKGDYTHNITYDLNEESVIMDLGGYTGVWAQQMINKYNPNVYIIEPIQKFHDGMKVKFNDNDKVHLLNVGVSIKDGDSKLFLNGDASSSNLKGGESIDIKLNTIETILKSFKISEVDLIQINIEGDEYPLLENMLETGSVNKFKNIQVQFHYDIEDYVVRRDNIRNGLIENGFEIKFDYPFVWESWCKKD